jgi:hypothetical protein
MFGGTPNITRGTAGAPHQFTYPSIIVFCEGLVPGTKIIFVHKKRWKLASKIE